jgi:hypothetical protein
MEPKWRRVLFLLIMFTLMGLDRYFESEIRVAYATRPLDASRYANYAFYCVVASMLVVTFAFTYKSRK